MVAAKRLLLIVVCLASLLLGGCAALRDGDEAAKSQAAEAAKAPPPVRLQVEAPDETGQVVRWSIEWGGSGQLTGQGVSRTTLKYGDVVTITANPSRTPNDHKLHMLTLHRKSDGFGWGTRPGEVTD